MKHPNEFLNNHLSKSLPAVDFLSLLTPISLVLLWQRCRCLQAPPAPMNLNYRVITEDVLAEADLGINMSSEELD